MCKIQLFLSECSNCGHQNARKTVVCGFLDTIQYKDQCSKNGQRTTNVDSLQHSTQVVTEQDDCKSGGYLNQKQCCSYCRKNKLAADRGK